MAAQTDRLTGYERTDAVLFAPDIPYDVKPLLAVIAAMQGGNGAAWPSRKHLQTVLGLSLGRLKRLTARARELGLLEVDANAGPSGVNRYRVTLDVPPDRERAGGTDAATPVRQRAGQARQQATGGRASEPTPGALARRGKNKGTKKEKTTLRECGESESRRSSGYAAWQYVCDAVRRYDPLYETAALRDLLSDQHRTAARAAGGLTTIAGRTPATETSIRIAFLRAWADHAATTSP